MATNEINTYLKYANLQMAAEAFLVDPDTLEKRFTGQLLINALQAGNKHASKFTEVAAKQFESEWEVVAQQANTGTGFSGTLFRSKVTDEARGLKAGDLVLSFRSTEFIDDSVHDNQATNVLEVKAFGWAFGQIDDMEKWYAELKANGSLKPTDRFAVTGYSLGANLATAFNLLRQEEAQSGGPNPITATYTYNGAGVGDLANGARLTDVVADFDRLRRNEDRQQIVFSDHQANLLYREWREVPLTDWTPLRVELEKAKAKLLILNISERDMLVTALTRIGDILAEADRVPRLSGGDGTSPKPILPADIDAARLDYQLAVLTAAKRAAAHDSGVISGAINAYARDTKSGLDNIYDVYGAAPPSAVAQSQWHYGTPVPIYIEDQPMYRGNAVWNALTQSLLYHDAKLLGPGYVQNDFGDTHSLVLIVDSLAVGDALARLDPTLTAEKMAAFFAAATATKMQTLGSSQGKAEGDTLETVVDALSRLLLKDDPKLRANPRLNDGGTWADLDPNSGKDLRTPFYTALDKINKAIKERELSGKVTVTLPATDQLASAARTDFGALLTLLTLSPFTLKAASGKEAEVESALSAAWKTEYDAWNADKLLTPAQRAGGGCTYTDQFLADRAAYLSWVIKANTANLQPTNGKTIFDGSKYGYQDVRNWEFTAIDSEPRLTRTIFVQGSLLGGTNKIVFGSENGDGASLPIVGALGNDRLYGLGGNDSLQGGKGDDWLEGNAGDDTLEGGQGNDTLLGGAGDDTYVFHSGDGWDWIEDQDGAGHIEYGGIRLGSTPLEKKGEGVWKQESGGQVFWYILTPWTEKGETFQRLSIQGPDGGVWIKRWQDGQLGIRLNADPPQLPLKVGTDDNDGLESDLAGQEVRSLGGWDTILLKHDDTIADGYADNDALAGGAGSDVLQGGDGTDFLFGDHDILPRQMVMPPVPAGFTCLAEGHGWQVNKQVDANYLSFVNVDFIGAPDGDDELDGGAGNDFLFAGGGDGNDYIEGMGGDDLIRGGTGDDTVFGDGNYEAVDADHYQAANPNYTPLDENGDDWIDGGAITRDAASNDSQWRKAA